MRAVDPKEKAMANQQVMTLLDEMKRDKNIVDQVIEKLPPKVPTLT